MSDYLPSPTEWVRNQVSAIEAAGTTAAVDVMGLPVVLLTMRGARSGAVRKVPLIRVERDGRYAAVASSGGAATHPQWYFNLLAHPRITLQDGERTIEVIARVVEGGERASWWTYAVAAFPPYADYQHKTDRTIPVFVLEPVAD